ncbi:MAG: hypothetical protein M3Y08_15110, partial [Fibrobacterota bacterium]|nr:hypothetical protein [Fibrobacterota bacterium]
ALAGFLGFALLLQCFLGMATIWTGKSPVPTTFHLSGGALVFATGVLLFMSICRLHKPVHGKKESNGNAVDPRSLPAQFDGVALT